MINTCMWYYYLSNVMATFEMVSEEVVWIGIAIANSTKYVQNPFSPYLQRKENEKLMLG